MMKSQMMKLVVASLFMQVGMILSLCKHKPLELGIVLDSSSSIQTDNFTTAKDLLKDFLRQFEISSKPNGVRVSIITYGNGVYPEIGFNLTTYNTRDKVINAIGKIPHRAGIHTDTGMAINFMRKYQMAKTIVRPGVPKVSIVITDGTSQDWQLTKKAAEDARNDGIVIFAVGVGRVKDSELLNIAGDASRVTKVDKYETLNTIKESLAYQACNVKVPADIFFLLSTRSLGFHRTKWATQLISLTLNTTHMEQGYRYGIISGSCKDIHDLSRYYDPDNEKSKVLQLVQTLVDDGFTKARGARQNSCKVAVIIEEGKAINDLQGLNVEVAALKEEGIHVIIADPTDQRVDFPGAIVLRGRSPEEQADDLLSDLSVLCHNEKQR